MNRLSIKFNKDHKERDELWLQTARKLYKLKMTIKEYEKEEAQTLASLKLLSCGINSKAGEFIFTKSMRRGSVVYKNIPQLIGVNLDQYRKDEVETWKLEPVLVPFDKEEL